MRKSKLALASVVALLASTVAAAAETVTFMGWVALFDFQKAGWDNIVKSFEEKHPDIKINYVGTPNENTLNQATLAINGGNAPDIIQVNPAWVPQLQGMGALEGLDGYVPAPELAQIPESYRKAMTFDGKLVALPWIPGPIAMVYNRDLLKEAGLDPDKPPTTWSAFTEAVKKVCALPERNGGKVYGVALRSNRHPSAALWSLPIIWANGGDVVDAQGHVRFGTPAAKAAFGWYKETITSGCSPEFFDIQESRNVFGQGRAGFIFEGPWISGLVQRLSGGKMKVGPQANVWLSNMPAPAGGAPRQLDNSNMLVMTAKAKQKKAAAEFIRFILSDRQAVEFFYKTSEQMTTGRMDLLTTGAMGQDPYVQAFTKAMAVSNPLAIRHVQSNAMMDALAPAIQSIVKGGDIDAELQKVDRAVERLQSR